MVKLLITMWLLGVADEGLSEPGASPIDPHAAYLTRLVVDPGADHADGEAEQVAADLATGRWHQRCYVDLARPQDVAWSLKVNATLMPKAATEVEAAKIARLQRAAHADAVLRRSDGGWQLVRVSASGALSVIGIAPTDDERPLVEQLPAILGYDAVVVTQRGDEVTAQTPDLTQVTEMYAVALADSSERYQISAGPEAPKTKLLRLLPGGGGKRLSRFKVVLSQDAKPLVFGTKLRLEKHPSKREL